MTVAGIITCRRCARGFMTVQEVGMNYTDGELCPICKGEQPSPPALPWATEAEEKVSAKAALEELLAEVEADEKDWVLNDKIDLAVRVEEERKKRERRPKL